MEDIKEKKREIRENMAKKLMEALKMLSDEIIDKTVAGW